MASHAQVPEKITVSRRCLRCGFVKPPSGFYACMPRCNICIECIRIAQARRNHARMERERQARQYAEAAKAGRLP